MDAETSVLDRLLGSRCECAIDAWRLLEESSGRRGKDGRSLASPLAPNGPARELPIPRMTTHAITVWTRSMHSAPED